MNFGIFLIILGFVHLVCCSNSNVTNNECDVCTLSWFRRKRDGKEYTRWKSNIETTQEFIVKVLEDDVSLPQIKKFAGINIAPFTKEREKIIIGGPITPSPTTPSDSDKLKDYTRFGPPSSLSVTAIDGNIILQPIKINDNAIAPIRPPGRKSGLEPAKNPLRDESPPARPQFLPKQQSLISRQYAPITPVSFTKRNSTGLSPLTGRGIDKSMLFREKTFQHPTRTSHAKLEVPKRTTELMSSVTYNYNYELRSQFVPKRTSQTSIIDLHRTITGKIETENSDFIPTIANSQNIVAQKGSSKIVHKETKMAYDLLYHDEDEISDPRRKEHHRTTDTYEDLHVIGNENVTRDDALNNAEERETTPDYSDSNNNDKDNWESTVRSSQQQLFGVATIQPHSIKLDDDEDEDKSKTTLKEKKVLICNILKRRQLSFSAPLTLYEIVTQLKQWADESPVAKWMDLTEGNFTIMENPIYMMMVDDPSSGQIMSSKRTVIIVAGIQGRDHHAVTAAMYVLYQLIERSEAHSDLLTKFRFWIVPVFNPDGYDYSMTFPQRREWTKNVRQSWDSCKGRILCRTCEEFGVGCTIRPCYGVNLDRNFEYQWIPKELRSEHPCGMLYAGPRQLSEAETIALTHFLHNQRTPIHTFIAFKEGDVLGIMYPYSHTKKRRAFDHIYRHRASRAAAAANSISGRPYVAGQTSEFLPLYAGGVEDWVDGHLGIDNTYTVMMFRPSDSYSSKVITERVVHEAYAAVDTLLLESVETPRSPQAVLTRAKASANSLFANVFIILPMVLGFG